MPTTHLATESWNVYRDAQKEGIAAALIELVNEQDAPITIAQISDRAGVSRPTFYKYFPTLGAAMLFAHHQVTEEITKHGQEQTSAEHADGLTQLLEGMRIVGTFAEARPDLVRFTSYFDYTFRRHGLTETEHRALLEKEGELATITYAFFQIGQQDGSIRADLRADEIVEVIGASMLGLAQRALVAESRNGINLRQHYDVALDAWSRYLSP